MKRLITFEPHHTETFTPAESFVNAYLDVTFTVVGSPSSSLDRSRDARIHDARGITLRIARDVNGDFTVEKVEEFGA